MKALRQSLTDLRVVVLAVTYLTGLIGLNGVYYWMPQIVKSFGLSNATVGLVTAIPHFFGAVAMIIWACSSDRSGKRVWHVATACLLGAVAMAASSLAPNSLLVMIGLTVALVGAYGFLATFWALPATFLTGRAAVGGFGLILSIGNSSGFFGPSLVGWLKQTTQGYSGSLFALSGFLLLACVLTLVFGRSMSAGSTPMRSDAAVDRSLSS